MTKATAVSYLFISQVFISVLFDFIDSILNQGCAHYRPTYTAFVKKTTASTKIHKKKYIIDGQQYIISPG